VRTVLGEIEIVYKNYSKFAGKTVEEAGPLMTWVKSFLPISKLVLSESVEYRLEVQQYLGDMKLQKCQYIVRISLVSSHTKLINMCLLM
jgi:hypothetical protein